MKKFLIAVDLQRDFVSGALGTPEARAIIGNAAGKIRSFDGMIFATLDTHGDNYSETAEGKKLPVPHCIKGTPGWEWEPEIKSALYEKGFTAVEKKTFGSAELPRLIEKAADGEDFSVELIGLCTDICVVSNALLLKAAFPEREISVDASCCAGATPESHKAALLTMKMCQLNIEGQPEG